MGIIFDTDNSYLTTFMDIVVIFLFGSLLLFFANVIQNEGKYLMMYISVIVIFILLFNMIYLDKKTEKEFKETNVYNILTFVNIYVMILMFLLSSMTYYMWSKTEDD